jgi:hypothetical protein
MRAAQQSHVSESGASSGMPIFLQRMNVVPKLKVNPASAAYEHQADRAAATPSNAGPLPAHPALRADSSSGTLQEPSLAGGIVRQRLRGTRGNGGALPAATRETMEKKLGADFSRVRVHSDSTASSLANVLGANAFTSGNDIYFNENRYQPESQHGQALLAHELTHVAQQGGQSAGPIQCDLMESLAPTALGGFEFGMAFTTVPVGMNGTIRFLPDPTGPYSTEITLIQTANVVDVGGATTPASGAPVDWSNVGTGSEAPRNEVRTPLGGTFVDAIYAAALGGSAVTPNYAQPTDIAANPAGNHHGWLRSPTDVRDASLADNPNASFDADFSFETVAKGSDNQVVYGSAEWGFQIRSGIAQNDHAVAHALESAEFDRALERFRGYYTHEPIVLYFDTDRDLPMAGELTKLGDVNSYMTRYPDVTLQMEGFADETGPADPVVRADYNSRLSLRRAENVVTILTGSGVDASRIDSLTVGHGATTAFAPGSPAAAPGSLRANRRVIITFVRNASTPIAP